MLFGHLEVEMTLRSCLSLERCCKSAQAWSSGPMVLYQQVVLWQSSPCPTAAHFLGQGLTVGQVVLAVPSTRLLMTPALTQEIDLNMFNALHIVRIAMFRAHVLWHVSGTPAPWPSAARRESAGRLGRGSGAERPFKFCIKDARDVESMSRILVDRSLKISSSRAPLGTDTISSAALHASLIEHKGVQANRLSAVAAMREVVPRAIRLGGKLHEHCQCYT